jgi:hypothetical protein
MFEVAKLNLQDPRLSDEERTFWERSKEGWWIKLLDFAVFVLCPHVATLMIASDLNLSVKEANVVRCKSQSMGNIFFPEENDKKAQDIANRARHAIVCPFNAHICFLRLLSFSVEEALDHFRQRNPS